MNPTEKLMALQSDSLEIIEKAHVNFKKSPKERITLGYVQGRLEAVENYFREFKCIHEKIVTSVSKEDKSKLSYFTEDIFDSYEERFYIYKGELKTVLQKFSTETKSNQGIRSGHSSQGIQGGNSSGHVTTSEIRLPHITIPCFSGDYTEWQSFHDLFTSLIHNNGSLDDVQKMHYLKVNLKGDAEVLLRQFPVTGENYTQAWTILKNRYDNKRYIANCLFKKFFAQRTIVQESATALKQLLDTSVECLNALKNLGLPTPEWDAIVIYIVVSKLDSGTHKYWEELINGEASAVVPTFEKLKSFLETRFRTLEMVEPVSKSYKPPQPKTFHVTSSDIECAFCKEKHLIHHCKQFAKRPVDERYDFVRNNYLCYNCLIPNHVVWRCKQKTSCQVCKRRHHSLLHRDTKQVEETQENKKVAMSQEDSKVVAHVRPSGEEDEQNILLATALVEVASKCGQPQVCRALIDQGSEASFVTARVVELLRLKKTAVSGVVSGISEDNNVCIKSKVELQISSRYEPDFAVKVNAYVLKSLTPSLPGREINCNMLPQLDNMKLADPTFNTPSRVDILLGADVFGKIIDSGFMRGPGDVVAQYTHLGWILSGDTNTTSSSSHRITSFHVTRQVEEDKNLLKRFLEIETEGENLKQTTNNKQTNMKTWSREEELCEENYKSTTTRDDTGRYIVHLPLKQRVEDTVKLCGETDQREYQELGYMKNAEAVHLRPHAVAKDDGGNTKMHMVVNTSAKSSNSISLNNALTIGPTLQPGLLRLANYWRAHKFSGIGDFTKKYCQVWLTDKHTDLQRTVWRDEPSENIESHKLLIMTSGHTGTAAASYVAVQTLSQLTDDKVHTYHRAALIVKNSYLDDLMIRCEDLSEIKKLCYEINSLLRSGELEMQKCSSNSEEMMEFFRHGNANEEPENKMEIKVDRVIKILKMTWDRNKEVVKIPLNLLEYGISTKRKTLPEILTLVYPFSWSALVVITAHVIVQRLPLCSLDCDDELPLDIIKEWKKYREELHQVQSIQIPRGVEMTTQSEAVPLDGFTVASPRTNVTIIYYQRVVNEENVDRVILFAIKTKSPLKQLTIPRAKEHVTESSVKLSREMYDLPSIHLDRMHIWMNAIAVLSRLQSRWSVCAGNRVSDIIQHINNSNSDCKQKLVQSVNNSTYLASGGVMARDMASSNMWWTGSERMKNKDEYCETTGIHWADRELKKTFNHILKDNPYRERVSSMSRLTRILELYLSCIIYTEKSKGGENFTTTEFNGIVVLSIKYYQCLLSSLDTQDLKNRRIKGQLPASSVTPRRTRVKIK